MSHDLTHIDVFSGIGGFSLAAGWAGFHTVAFCEIDPYCQAVLKQKFGAIADAEGARLEGPIAKGDSCAGGRHSKFPDGPILIPDIRALDGSRFRGATLLTAGVPCQPASVAGKRLGTADDRWLWPEALRILAEVKPTWAVFENPSGILSLESGMVFENLLSQMEGQGYEVQPIVIPACAINAPHRRDRVWIIAHSKGERRRETREHFRRSKKRTSGTNRFVALTESGESRIKAEPKGRQSIGRRSNEDARHSYRSRTVTRSAASGSRNPISESDSDAPDSAGAGLSHRRGSPMGEHGPESQPQRCPSPRIAAEQWAENWIEVATRLCRVDDGLPAWIHRHRVHRLKALGNAVVPQVAYQIIKGIAEISRRTSQGGVLT